MQAAAMTMPGISAPLNLIARTLYNAMGENRRREKEVVTESKAEFAALKKEYQRLNVATTNANATANDGGLTPAQQREKDRLHRKRSLAAKRAADKRYAAQREEQAAREAAAKGRMQKKGKGMAKHAGGA